MLGKRIPCPLTLISPQLFGQLTAVAIRVNPNYHQPSALFHFLTHSLLCFPRCPLLHGEFLKQVHPCAWKCQQKIKEVYLLGKKRL